jgi:hypothetical protein
MLQPCEETTVSDIESCKALIADLHALHAKAEAIAYRCGEELNSAADFAATSTEPALEHLRNTLRTLEGDDAADQRRAVVELRHDEARVA